MKKYVIEREIPGIGSLAPEDYRAAAAKSNQALAQLAPDIEWIESFVAADKTFCVYRAKDEAIIHKHAVLSGFPANKITEIKTAISPSTAQPSTPVAESLQVHASQNQRQAGREAVSSVGSKVS